MTRRRRKRGQPMGFGDGDDATTDGAEAEEGEEEGLGGGGTRGGGRDRDDDICQLRSDRRSSSSGSLMGSFRQVVTGRRWSRRSRTRGGAEKGSRDEGRGSGPLENNDDADGGQFHQHRRRHDLPELPRRQRSRRGLAVGHWVIFFVALPCCWLATYATFASASASSIRGSSASSNVFFVGSSSGGGGMGESVSGTATYTGLPRARPGEKRNHGEPYLNFPNKPEPGQPYRPHAVFTYIRPGHPHYPSPATTSTSEGGYRYPKWGGKKPHGHSKSGGSKSSSSSSSRYNPHHGGTKPAHPPAGIAKVIYFHFPPAQHPVPPKPPKPPLKPTRPIGPMPPPTPDPVGTPAPTAQTAPPQQSIVPVTPAPTGPDTVAPPTPVPEEPTVATPPPTGPDTVPPTTRESEPEPGGTSAKPSTAAPTPGGTDIDTVPLPTPEPEPSSTSTSTPSTATGSPTAAGPTQAGSTDGPTQAASTLGPTSFGNTTGPTPVGTFAPTSTGSVVGPTPGGTLAPTATATAEAGTRAPFEPEGIDVSASPYALVYEGVAGLPTTPGHFQSAAVLTIAHVEAFVTAVFEANADVILFQVISYKLGEATSPVRIGYELIGDFSELSLPVPTQEDLDAVVRAAFEGNAGAQLVAQLNELPLDNPFSAASGVVYSTGASQMRIGPTASFVEESREEGDEFALANGREGRSPMSSSDAGGEQQQQQGDGDGSLPIVTVVSVSVIVVLAVVAIGGFAYYLILSDRLKPWEAPEVFDRLRRGRGQMGPGDQRRWRRQQQQQQQQYK